MCRPVGRQMTIENSVSNDFWSTFVDSINVFDCRLSRVELRIPKMDVVEWWYYYCTSRLTESRTIWRDNTLVTFLEKALKWWSSVVLFAKDITSTCFFRISQHQHFNSSTTKYQTGPLFEFRKQKAKSQVIRSQSIIRRATIGQGNFISCQYDDCRRCTGIIPNSWTRIFFD